MNVPRLGVKSELQLPAYTSAIATTDPSLVCKLHHSSWQCQILNPLRPVIEPVTSWILVGFVTTEPQWELPLLKTFFEDIYLVLSIKSCTKRSGFLLHFLSNIILAGVWFFFFFFFLWPNLQYMEGARGWMRSGAADLHHSHSNVRSKPHLQPTTQLVGTASRSLSH